MHDMKPMLLPAQKSALAMSRAQYLAKLRDLWEPADKLSIGVCIFQMDVQTCRPSVLLLRRSLRWHQHPGTWELPGGKVGDGDFCISAAIARRVEEETGLEVVKILSMLQETRHVSEVKFLEWDDDDLDQDTGGTSDSPSVPLRVVRKRNLQLNFTVLVESTEAAVLVSEQHDEMVWASFSKVEELRMPGELRRVAHQALAWAGEYLF
ncbi:Uu.00g077960.m01.CDS01 [Anthostomella pinea]|uniref:Uu.00g077960.m01.CDS01 n=1 Tax=Anthostomella pinea TaxID=933095 RepID=A0AAI8VLN3_9PEZI|nr:Uu.00g077960.m01.CDS01 [Anthostomella pinea]